MKNIPGFYGKIPSLGDFVNRRLPNDFIEPWDQWLQASMVASKQALRDSWLEHYLSSPIWRFVISDGLCGISPWMGVIMPSVDAVGRYYPLVIAAKLVDGVNPIQVANLGATWFEMASEVILGVLNDDNQELNTFDANVGNLGGLDHKLFSGKPNASKGFGSAWQIPLENSNLAQPISTLTHQLLTQRLGAYSVWWGAGSSTVSPSFLICANLPLPTDFACMLSGNWQAGSWEQWSLHTESSELAKNSLVSYQ